MIEYDNDNIFAKILRNEIPVVKLLENDTCLAVMDAFPQSNGHVLMIPKSASRNLLDAEPQSLGKTMPYIQKLAIAVKIAMNADGIQIAQFNEAPAGQTVFHLHWHIIPRYKNIPLGTHGDDMADTDELEAFAKKIIAEIR